MTDIYVPIDYSNLKAVIPPGEDIIYSTLCKAKKSSTGMAGVTTTKWISHVLMTPKGIAFMEPRRKKSMKLKYFDWYKIRRISKTIIPITLKIFLKLEREPNFESKGDYNKRVNEFREKFKVIIEKRKKEWELKIPDKRKRNAVAKDRKFEMEI